jgi:rubrerythrin
LWYISDAINSTKGKGKEEMSDKTSRIPIEYLFTPEDLEKHLAELRKEEQEAKGLLQKMNLVALKALCALYDNKVGDYPENEYEGESFWEYVENLNTQVEKETKDGKEEMTKKLLLISGWDEWYGPVYTCPSCGEEKLMDNFNFCPFCGADTKGLKFESIEDQQKRIKKEDE